VADKSWKREFEDPIPLPDGTHLKTLREAISYLAKAVPISERDTPAVTTSGQCSSSCGNRHDVSFHCREIISR
jgi:hypothetical protein